MFSTLHIQKPFGLNSLLWFQYLCDEKSIPKFMFNVFGGRALQAHMLKASSPAGEAILGGSGNFRGWAYLVEGGHWRQVLPSSQFLPCYPLPSGHRLPLP
jgi:hypothetical protein